MMGHLVLTVLAFAGAAIGVLWILELIVVPVSWLRFRRRHDEDGVPTVEARIRDLERKFRRQRRRGLCGDALVSGRSWMKRIKEARK